MQIPDKKVVTEEEWAKVNFELIEARSQLSAANARIAELERCVVCGGDGKPIGLGDTRYMWDPVEEEIIEFVVDYIRFIEPGGFVKKGRFLVYCPNRGPMCEPSDCYSSPDQVPEGCK